MISPSTLARAVFVLAAGAVMVGNATAVTIDFNTANSCFAANFGGTTCSLTPGPVVYTNLAGDAASIGWISLDQTATTPGNNIPTNISYGIIELNYSSNNGDNQAVTVGPTTFLLHIQETGPQSIAYQTIAVNISADGGSTPGSVGPQSSSLEASFLPVSVTYGSTTFSIVPAVQLLAAPTTTNGDTTIQGRVVDTGVPEPSTCVLFGSGLLAVFMATRKNFKRC